MSGFFDVCESRSVKRAGQALEVVNEPMKVLDEYAVQTIGQGGGLREGLSEPGDVLSDVGLGETSAVWDDDSERPVRSEHSIKLPQNAVAKLPVDMLDHMLCKNQIAATI